MEGVTEGEVLRRTSRGRGGLVRGQSTTETQPSAV
jgi:hypothetical protein